MSPFGVNDSFLAFLLFTKESEKVVEIRVN